MTVNQADIERLLGKVHAYVVARVQLIVEERGFEVENLGVFCKRETRECSLNGWTVRVETERATLPDYEVPYGSGEMVHVQAGGVRVQEKDRVIFKASYQSPVGNTPKWKVDHGDNPYTTHSVLANLVEKLPR